MTPPSIRVAAAQYPIEELTSFAAFEAKLTRWVREAASHGAQLLVFPEYAALELARLAGRHVSGDLRGSIEALRFYLGDYDAVYSALAKEYGVHILGGSAPVKLMDGGFVNRARLFAPSGASGYQQKSMMTRFEAEKWGIGPGSKLCVFDTAVGKLGITICYDVEFPLIARALAEAGAEILLAPSCTEALSGYHRVKTGCAARALENQIFAIQSPTVGEAPWLAGLEMNVGAAGVFAPPDRQFSADGIVAQGALNAPLWVFADLDLQALARIREDGEVLNSRNWHLQPGAAALPAAKTVALE
jgi:predicted amidohydrolase